MKSLLTNEKMVHTDRFMHYIIYTVAIPNYMYLSGNSATIPAIVWSTEAGF
jgi:hypothetical protein